MPLRSFLCFRGILLDGYVSGVNRLNLSHGIACVLQRGVVDVREDRLEFV